MRIVKLLLVVLGLPAVFGCSKPIPVEKKDYVGEWHGAQMDLVLTQSGGVVYKRKQGSKSVSLDGPLQAFVGDDFVVGVGPFKTTFVVSTKPHQEGESWRMTVDGVVLSRD